VNVLEQILARKREEARALEREHGFAALRARAEATPPARDFAAALRAGERPRVIAEFKRASPSRGEIRPGADPAEIARAYAGAGAAALSVLTDGPSFGGSLGDLRRAREAVPLPVLRKDFTVAPIQVLEARAAGADAVLLIVAALEPAELKELRALAGSLGLAALVEVHTRRELEVAREAGAALLGINNRDLRSFETDVARTLELLPHARGCTVVSESGIDRPEVVERLQSEGAHAFLVGEALMFAPDPGAALRRLRGRA
jgi:indole-3-glycerol phosphate synthase